MQEPKFLTLTTTSLIISDTEKTKMMPSMAKLVSMTRIGFSAFVWNHQWGVPCNKSLFPPWHMGGQPQGHSQTIISMWCSWWWGNLCQSQGFICDHSEIWNNMWVLSSQQCRARYRDYQSKQPPLTHRTRWWSNAYLQWLRRGPYLLRRQGISPGKDGAPAWKSTKTMSVQRAVQYSQQ